MRYFAVGKYFKKLYPALKDRYGVNDTYTAGQVKRTVFEYSFSNKHLPYAYGLFLTEHDLGKVLESEFPELNFVDIRRYLANRFFKGDSEFSFKSVVFSSSLGGGGADNSGASSE